MFDSKFLKWSTRLFIAVCIMMTILYAITTGGNTTVRFFLDIFATIQFGLLLGVVIFMVYSTKHPRLFILFYCSLPFIQIIPIALIHGSGWNDNLLIGAFHIFMFVWGLFNLFAIIKKRRTV